MNNTKASLLQQQAEKFGTPVSQLLDAYHEQFENRREEVERLLVIGIAGGESYRMWADFFPLAEITCLDRPPRSSNQDSSGVGTSETQAESHRESIPQGLYDVLIDTGGLHVTVQKESLIQLWRAVKPGGVYVVENLETSYLARFGGGFERSHSMVEFLKNHIDGINRKPLEKFLKRFKLSDKASIPPNALVPRIHSIQFYGSLCFLNKQRN